MKKLYKLILVFLITGSFSPMFATITFYDFTPNLQAMYSSGTGTPVSFSVGGYTYYLKYDAAGFTFYNSNPSDSLIGAELLDPATLAGYTGAVDHITPTSSAWRNSANKILSWGGWGTMLAFRIPVTPGNYKYAWLWVDVVQNDKATIFSYGYENVPNTQILAGLMSGGASSSLEENGDDISVYPNPTSNYIMLPQNNNPYKNIVVQSENGSVLNIYNMNNGNNTIDVSTYTNGVYILTIEYTNGSRVYKKIIKN